MEKILHFKGIEDFMLSVNYIDNLVITPETAIDQHTHSDCEIFIHLDGDVSFMVEDNLYPISKGSVIITKPYEYHHCIYHRRTKHHHYCLRFTCKGSEALFPVFFDRERGHGNLLVFQGEGLDALIGVCEALRNDELRGINAYLKFFELISMLEKAGTADSEYVRNTDISTVLKHIHLHYAEKLTVKGLADLAHVSISTLERWFDEQLGITPTLYIKQLRLAHALRLLTEQYSVIETAERCGFTDVSAMITAFKKQYGITPHRYKHSKNGTK